ncbi:MAG: outer membrane beta-barrel domain-containing protein [Deltaproteobacteria bacterium]|nr:outer membrane beta-barrel domain-containing protein [Deltaproteobacteria bacterium]
MRLVTSAVAVLFVAAPAFAQDDAPPDDKGAKNETVVTPEAGDASEFQRVEERAPRAGTPLISNKLYPMQYRFELTGFFDISYADKYVDHLGGHAGVGFHLFDWLAFEGFGGYLVGDETGIVENVRLDGKSAGLASGNAACANDLCEPQLPDMYQTTWFAGANVQWSPIYGKLSAVSEYDLNFQFYGKLGGGAEGIQRLQNDLSFSAPGVRPSLNYGLGVRLIPWKYMAIRAELTNYVGVNPNVEEHDVTDEGNCADGYILGQGNQESCLSDFSQNSMFQIGVSFLL